MGTMKALVKRKADGGTVAGGRARPPDGHQRRVDRSAADRHLRHRPPYLQLGRLGAEDGARAVGGGTRIRGPHRRGGLQREGLPSRRHRQRRGPRGLRAVPQLPGGPAAPLQGHQGNRRQSARRLRRILGLAHDQRLGPRPLDSARRAVDLRSLRQRGAYRAAFSRAGRGRVGDRRRADRRDGGGGGPPRRRPLRGGHRRQSLSARIGPPHGGHACRRRPLAIDRLGPAGTGHEGGVRRRPGDVGQPRGVPRHARPTCATAARSPCWASPARRWPSTGPP